MEVTSPPPAPAAADGAAGLRVFEPVARALGVSCLAAGVAAFVWLGVGGRAAMRLVTLTSDSAFRGMLTDDDFVVGDFDLGNTIGFVLFLTIGGAAFGGAVVTGIRAWLRGPLGARTAAAAVLGGVVGGNLIVRTDGVDFRILGPLWVTVGLFVLIPALYGASTVLLAEWLLRPGGWGRRGSPWPRIAPAVLLLIPPLGFVTAAVALVAYALQRTAGGEWFRTRGVALAGWAAAAGLAGLSLVVLAGKVADLA